MQIESPTVLIGIVIQAFLDAPVGACVGITMSDRDLRERGAEEWAAIRAQILDPRPAADPGPLALFRRSMGRSRLRTPNDREALVEQLAEEMWLSRRDRDIDPDKWEDSGAYWHRVMRQFAKEAIGMLARG